MSGGAWAMLMFFGLCAALALGYPVAMTLAGVGLIFAGIGSAVGAFDPAFLEALPNRVFGTMSNDTLVAVPLFVFMGVMLERARIAERLLLTMGALFGGLRGGLAISVMLVGAVLAASTGIVGATVTTMGLIALPTMLRYGYDARLASGTICAAGTLGQIIPPSVILVLLGDVLSNAYQQAQLKQGIYAPKTVAVGDLFSGALIPGLVLVALYLVYILWTSWRHPERAPAIPIAERSAIGPGDLLKALAAPLGLILAVLGSILYGVATPTEAAAVGAVGAMLFGLLNRELNLARLREVMQQTVLVSSMVFLILIGAALFSLVFRGFGGDDTVHALLSDLPGGKWGALLAVMTVMFLLGFVIDFIEIIFVVVPLTAPTLLALGIDPVWLGVLFAVNLQTSFLTPPFGFALFYLRGVAPPTLRTADIYRGVVPFIVLQVVMLLIMCLWPELATWLPGVMATR
ncbi:MAG: TRAP transporter large permease subunit [Xanthomonadales bacterium]|nr:TRAP transporter large permease subunit [Xanthomonadales bacterium]